MSANGHDQQLGEEALARHGFDGRRLMRLGQRVISDWARRAGADLPPHTREDLLSFLCTRGVHAAIRYDPERYPQVKYGQNGGDPFQSYLADVMEQRIPDFFRRKSEGFGDRRHGFDGRVVLAGEDVETIPGQGEVEEPDAALLARWGEAARLFCRPMVKWEQVTERRAIRWMRVADAAGVTLEEFIVITLDRQAKAFDEQQAAA